MNDINDIIQSSNADGSGTGLRFVPSQWTDGEITGYDAITIEDTMDDDLGIVIRLRRQNPEDPVDEAWTMQITSPRGSTPVIQCPDLVECWKTCQIWWTGICEGRVIQSNKDIAAVSNAIDETSTSGFYEDDLPVEGMTYDYDVADANDPTVYDDTEIITPVEGLPLPDDGPREDASKGGRKRHGLNLMGWIASLVY